MYVEPTPDDLVKEIQREYAVETIDSLAFSGATVALRHIRAAREAGGDAEAKAKAVHEVLRHRNVIRESWEKSSPEWKDAMRAVFARKGDGK